MALAGPQQAIPAPRGSRARGHFGSATHSTPLGAAMPAPASSHTSAAPAGASTPLCSAVLGSPGSAHPPPAPPPQRPNKSLVVSGSFPFSPQVPPTILNSLLTGYDSDLRSYLVTGFTRGFSTGCTDLSARDAQCNLPSCHDAPIVIDQCIATEREAGRIAGPFARSYRDVTRISPIGLVPKKAPGAYRVIHHLSFPYGDSVNDSIPRAHTAVQYGSMDDALDIISDLEHQYLAKTDIVNAFRLIPIAEAEIPLLGFRWRDSVYADRALPMGCASSSQIFQSISDALMWMAQKKIRRWSRRGRAGRFSVHRKLSVHV